MSTIVVNTLTGAVSEYDWNPQSITPNYMGDVTGLYALGGDDDAGQPIAAKITTPKKTWDTDLKKFMASMIFSMSGSGSAAASVMTRSAEYAYEFAVAPGGVSRCKVGRGIQANYLGFGFANKDGADFRIDSLGIEMNASTSRRT